MTYTLYINYKDDYICKFKTRSDDWNKVYEEYSKNMIIDGMRKGFNIKRQIDTFHTFCDMIWKQKRDCYKIRRSDYMMFMSCFFGLVKYGKIPVHDFIFLKNKRKKKK